MKHCPSIRRLVSLVGAAGLAWVLSSCRSMESDKETSVQSPAAFQFLKVEGSRVVDEAGNKVALKGCNLGSWLLLEMWMMDMGKLGANGEVHDQHSFEAILTERFGKDGAARLMETFRENWITERDFEIISSFGFNVVRLPFHYSLLEDDGKPMQLKPDAFKWLDRAVSMAERNGLYVILDLHGTPGGQSVDHTTGRAGQNLLWESKEYRERTVWLWTELAKHFRNSKVVAAYDLINEPFGDYKTDKHLNALVEITDECYRSIRAVGDNHPVIFPGAREGIKFYGAPRDHGWTNAMFTEHYYPGLFAFGSPELATHKKHINQTLRWVKKYLDDVEAGFLIGEFNVVFRRAGGHTLMRHYYDLHAENGWWSTMWSHKLVTKSGGIGRDNWYLVVNKTPAPAITLRTSSYEEIEQFFKWLGSVEYDIDEELREVLTMDNPPRLVMDEKEYPQTAPHADPVSVWQITDVGGSMPAGGQRVHSDRRMDIYGGGKDIWDSEDRFRFLWQKVDGNFTLQAKVLALDEVHPCSKAGLMIRSSLDMDSPHILLHIFPDGRVIVGERTSKGAVMTERKFKVGDFPVRLRASRSDGNILLEYSNGQSGAWKEAVSVACPWLEDSCLAGLAVLSHDQRFLAMASFDEIGLSVER